MTLLGPTERDFNVGDRVVWFHEKQGSQGYVQARNAVIIAMSPKRIKIRLDGDGQRLERWVMAENLMLRAFR